MNRPITKVPCGFLRTSHLQLLCLAVTLMLPAAAQSESGLIECHPASLRAE
ncbi:hypothetical protein LCGC14_2584320, partial [marine sediment metagenome]